jgi:hypothetical protein
LRVTRSNGDDQVYISSRFITTCGACDYFEDDGSLQHQCADCAMADAARVFLMRSAGSRITRVHTRALA